MLIINMRVQTAGQWDTHTYTVFRDEKPITLLQISEAGCVVVLEKSRPFFLSLDLKSSKIFEDSFAFCKHAVLLYGYVASINSMFSVTATFMRLQPLQ